jgi:hypothetical protein
LDTVITVPRQRLNPDRLRKIAAAAAGRAGAAHPVHLTRYPAFVRRLRTADVEGESIPAIARDIIEHTERRLIPSAVDRELRLAILRSDDWEEAPPQPIAAPAEADLEAHHELPCRLLGMGAWQDLDLSRAGPPIGHFGTLQTRHETLLDALGWTPPERTLLHAREAIDDDPEFLDLVFGPMMDGVVIWECEELIEMGVEFVATLNQARPTVGVHIKNGAMRRPYAESHGLLKALKAQGVECIPYSNLDLASGASSIDRSTIGQGWGSQQNSQLGREGDST